MMYVDGGSLSDRIRRGAIPIAEIRRLLEQIAGALDYAHRQNVVHRDIKPDNILLDREGHALLADFGIVKLMEGVSTSALTATGGLVGTPAYMSPEQAQGLPLDNRSDIYSLGIVVFEMLTGRQPFSAETPMQLVFEHITTPVPPLHDFNAELSPELDAVLRRALDKKPENRYSTAKEFYEDFSRVVQGEPSLAGTRTFAAPAEDAEPLITYTPPPGTVAPPPQTMPSQPTPTQTMAPSSSLNPLILLGGFAVIALLVVAVVFIVINPNANRAVSEVPTTAPTTAPSTRAPATVQPTQPRRHHRAQHGHRQLHDGRLPRRFGQRGRSGA